MFGTNFVEKPHCTVELQWLEQAGTMKICSHDVGINVDQIIIQLNVSDVNGGAPVSVALLI